MAAEGISYQQMNEAAKKITAGSDELVILPFGNGAERMLGNKTIHAHIQNIDLNKHTNAHLFRAAQEGIVFALRYGLDIMRENGINPHVVRAGKANMFLSDVFTQSFADVNNVAVEFYEGDGSFGAAIGAGIGAGIFADAASAFAKRKPAGVAEPKQTALYEELYQNWKRVLKNQLNKGDEINGLS
jgi:xylulokinase